MNVKPSPQNPKWALMLADSFWKNFKRFPPEISGADQGRVEVNVCILPTDYSFHGRESTWYSENTGSDVRGYSVVIKTRYSGRIFGIAARIATLAWFSLRVNHNDGRRKEENVLPCFSFRCAQGKSSFISPKEPLIPAEGAAIASSHRHISTLLPRCPEPDTAREGTPPEDWRSRAR